MKKILFFSALALVCAPMSAQIVGPGWSRDSILSWCDTTRPGCHGAKEVPSNARGTYTEFSYIDDSSGFYHYHFDSTGVCYLYEQEWLSPEECQDLAELFSDTALYVRIAPSEWRETLYYGKQRVPYRHIYWRIYIDPFDGGTLVGRLENLPQ